MFGRRMTTLAFLLLELSSLLVFEFNYIALYLNALHNILMLLGRNVELDETTYCLQI